MRHTDEEERVLAAAIRKYGPRGQLIVAAEELGELQKEIFKALPQKFTRNVRQRRV